MQLRVFAVVFLFAVVAAERKISIFPSMKRHQHKHKQAVAAKKPRALVSLPAAVAPETPQASAAVASEAAEEPDSAGAGGGFPELPAVSAMMGTASDTMKAINSQASILEARLAQAQMENEAKMSRQKTVFEQKLKLQETESRTVQRVNGQISADIASLEKSNAALKTHCKDLESGNHIMRSELKLLQSRFSTVQSFIASSLTSTDDTRAKELAVLDGSAPAKHGKAAASAVHKAAKSEEEEDDDADEQGADDESDDDDEADKTATSFVSMAMKVRRASTEMNEQAQSSEIEALFSSASQSGQASGNPKELLDVLSSGVEKLQQEEKESETKLKAMFLESFKAGVKRRASLLQQQASLNATRTSLLTLESQLHDAEERLETTKSDLERRLQGVGNFIEKLAQLAFASRDEAPHAMRGLPASIALPATSSPPASAEAAVGADVADLPDEVK